MHHSRLQYAKQNSTARNCTRSNNLGTPTHELHCSAPNSRSYNYIFKVLFTTPSWYVFPIGFGHMSRFWWSVPPVHSPVQRNATQIVYTVHGIKQIAYGSITLIGSVLQTGSICTLTGEYTHIQQFNAHSNDSCRDIFPVHSQWLKASNVVYYPPLTNMLKFGGYTRMNPCTAH